MREPQGVAFLFFGVALQYFSEAEGQPSHRSTVWMLPEDLAAPQGFEPR
jgi:hypothetical protein